MLKRMGVLAILLILWGSTVSFASDNWYYVGMMNGAAAYIDNSTVQKDDRVAYIWLRGNNANGKEIVRHILVDRYGKRYMLIEGIVDGVLTPMGQFAKFDSIPPDSIIEKVVDLIW